MLPPSSYVTPVNTGKGAALVVRSPWKPTLWFSISSPQLSFCLTVSRATSTKPQTEMRVLQRTERSEQAQTGRLHDLPGRGVYIRYLFLKPCGPPRREEPACDRSSGEERGEASRAEQSRGTLPCLCRPDQKAASTSSLGQWAGVKITGEARRKLV